MTEVQHTHLPEDDEEVRAPELVRHRELSDEQPMQTVAVLLQVAHDVDPSLLC